ncbi:MAG: NUDIX hydrolase [Holosporaceae bacterium]|jgi:8-oxo-dGTP pyrophosphatase MutT (NUDIX family)|nr:NUDIX hydrolase [Holosporaceae bacterium]
MHRKDLRKKLKRYNPEDEIEIAARAKMLDFLNSHEDCFERSLSIGHFTGSCWLVNCDETKFLLTLHKKMGFWLQLGGHADGDHDLVRVSLKEAYEESGLRNIELLSEEIFDIGVHLIPEYKEIPAHYHYDVRFLLKTTNGDDDIQISDESTDLRWFDEVHTFPADISIDTPRMFEKWKNNVPKRNNLQNGPALS